MRTLPVCFKGFFLPMFRRKTSLRVILILPAKNGGGRTPRFPRFGSIHRRRTALSRSQTVCFAAARDDNFPRTDESEEVFELSLEYGTLLDRHTDFYLPGNPPIQFERVTRPGWTGPMGFGISGTHSYDKYLRSPDDMGTIQVIQPEGNWLTLKRVPRWLPLLSLVKYVDTDFSGNFYEMRWHATPFENFSLTRYDGQVESYLPCDDKVLCYETAFRDREAQELVFERDANRRLLALHARAPQHLSRWAPRGPPLADGSTYTLTYKSWSAEDSASIVIVGASGGPSLKVAIKGFESTVWELPATEAER